MSGDTLYPPTDGAQLAREARMAREKAAQEPQEQTQQARTLEADDVLAHHREGRIIGLYAVVRHHGVVTEHHKSPEPLELVALRQIPQAPPVSFAVAEAAAQSWFDAAATSPAVRAHREKLQRR